MFPSGKIRLDLFTAMTENDEKLVDPRLSAREDRPFEKGEAQERNEGLGSVPIRCEPLSFPRGEDHGGDLLSVHYPLRLVVASCVSSMPRANRRSICRAMESSYCFTGDLKR